MSAPVAQGGMYFLLWVQLRPLKTKAEVAWGAFFEDTRGKPYPPNVISESCLPVSHLLAIPSPESKAFQFTKEIQVQKANFLKKRIH